MRKPKRNYSKEFKERTVQLSYERENVKELANELGVQVQLLYKWRAAQRTSKELRSPVKESETSEVKRLKKKLKETELELEILKKAVHIFSKSDGESINS